MIVKAGRTPRILPFPMDHIERTADGVLRYTELVPSLVHLLRATVEAGPDTEALVELGGERLTYRELWDRAARVAGGLRARRRARRPRRHPAPQRQRLGARVLRRRRWPARSPCR